MTIDIMKLSTLSETELNKLTKAELVAAICNNAFYPNHYKSEAEKLQKQINENATNERAACVMLASFVGVPLEKNEYSGQIETRQLNILELAGMVAAKCVNSKQ